MEWPLLPTSPVTRRVSSPSGSFRATCGATRRRVDDRPRHSCGSASPQARAGRSFRLRAECRGVGYRVVDRALVDQDQRRGTAPDAAGSLIELRQAGVRRRSRLRRRKRLQRRTELRRTRRISGGLRSAAIASRRRRTGSAPRSPIKLAWCAADVPWIRRTSCRAPSVAATKRAASCRSAAPTIGCTTAASSTCCRTSSPAVALSSRTAPVLSPYSGALATRAAGRRSIGALASAGSQLATGAMLRGGPRGASDLPSPAAGSGVRARRVEARTIAVAVSRSARQPGCTTPPAGAGSSSEQACYLGAP
jgi:hypothetical protein